MNVLAEEAAVEAEAAVPGIWRVTCHSVVPQECSTKTRLASE